MSADQKLEVGDLFFYTNQDHTFAYLVLKTYTMGNFPWDKYYFDALILSNKDKSESREYNNLRVEDFFPNKGIHCLYKFSRLTKIK